MADLKQVIESSFIQYAGAVLQSRALVDVRDCLKPSARQIFYSFYKGRYTSDKPFNKTLKGIGLAMHYYIHGDSSCEGIIMRAGQSFSYRYPLVEVEGSCGNLMSAGNWAAPRYTASRLSSISNVLFDGIGKNAISDWRDNYDNTEQYPSVLPSIGFYNIVNGSMGIGLGAASHIPPTNLREVNKAIIKLIYNSKATDDEIYCAPDFPTGGILLNPRGVREAMLAGRGNSCLLRAKIEYNKEENCLIVCELPYALYTDTVCEELEKILEKENNLFFERFNDLTGSKPEIKIYLKRNADVKKAIRFLYKNTSLETSFAINLTMLDDGCFPRVFGWRDALMAYITHIRECKKREIQFDLDRALSRENVLNGLIQACAHIDEIVAIIRASDSPAIASERLIARFQFNEEQTKAILAMKLSSLTRMDADKLCEELAEIQREIGKCRGLINSPKDLDEELVKALREVADKFGDDRRTQILEQEEPEEEEEDMPVEQDITVYLLDDHTYIWRATNSKRALKLPNGVGVVEEIETTSANRLLIFTKDGTFGTMPITENKENEPIIVPFMNPVFCCVASRLTSFSTILFITKNGMVKKSDAGLYLETRSRKPITAIKLKEDDSVIGVHILTRMDDYVLIRSATHYVCFSAVPISSTGRAATGVRAIKLKDNEVVVSSEIGELTSCPYTITSMNVRGEKIV